jgi:hypothetical protein
MGRKTVSCNGVEATLSSSEEGPRRARRHERRRPVRGRLVGDKPAGVHVGQVRAEEEVGQNCQPSISAGEPQQDRARAIDSMAGQIAAAHPSRGGTASLRRSGCSTRGDRFRSSRGFSGATPPWSRRARRRRDRRYIRCRSRVAPPTSLRPDSYRSAALHRAVRRAARRHGGPAEPPVAVPGYGSGPLSALSAERTHSFGTGLKAVQSRLGRGYLEVFASMTRSRTWVMEMRFVTRCTATASLR